MAEMSARNQVTDQLYDAVMNRMNITWKPDPSMEMNIRSAIEEAQDHLRSIAGNKELSFESGMNRTLLITCSWYIIENKRAEFDQEYSSDLLMLRLTEGFDCGKEAESAV